MASGYEPDNLASGCDVPRSVGVSSGDPGQRRVAPKDPLALVCQNESLFEGGTAKSHDQCSGGRCPLRQPQCPPVHTGGNCARSQVPHSQSHSTPDMCFDHLKTDALEPTCPSPRKALELQRGSFLQSNQDFRDLITALHAVDARRFHQQLAQPSKISNCKHRQSGQAKAPTYFIPVEFWSDENKGFRALGNENDAILYRTKRDAPEPGVEAAFVRGRMPVILGMLL